MAVASGPNVVEDGLVLALDAGNTKSYPGSGSTWTDTVGSNNGTLTNGPTFSRDNGGYIAFDGTDDYVQLPASSDLDFGTGNFTLEGWFNKSATTTLQVLLCSNKYYIHPYNGNWILRISSPTQIAFATYDGTGNPEYTEFSASTSVDTWHHFALVREGTGTNETKFYLDGVLKGSMTVSKSLTDAGTNGLRIGEESDSGAGNNLFNGKISNVKIYKGKGFTAAEVLQNYNATKNRYNFVWSLPEIITGTVFDFTGGSLPSGMYQDSDGPTVTWGANSVELAGDAPNDGASYPLRVATSFTGDYLFQLSTRIDTDPSNTNHCSDASIGLFNTAYNTSDWNWKWGVLSGRISAQNNCDTPTLYGHTNTTSMSGPNSGDVLEPPYVADGGWITMHLYHEPSQSRTRYKVTLGEKDWDASGTQIGNAPNNGVLEISDYFSGTYYVGISADDDDDECHMNGFRYVAL